MESSWMIGMLRVFGAPKNPLTTKSFNDFVDLQKNYGRMIANFATKMLSLKDLLSQDFKKIDLRNKLF